MASGDRFLFEIARQALLLSLPDPDAIAYRQQVLTDCLAQPDVVRELYELAGEALKAQRSVWGTLLRDSPRTILSSSVAKMELFVGFLRRLREMTDEHAGEVQLSRAARDSSRCSRTSSTRTTSGEVEEHLKALKFKGGMLISAQLDRGKQRQALPAPTRP